MLLVPGAAQAFEGHSPAEVADAARATAAARLEARTVDPGAVARWQKRLVAHLNRHKRFPRDAPAGAATVGFTIGRRGQVLAVSLLKSAGDAALDAEAVAMVRRADPVPAPPKGLSAPISFTLPLRYRR